MPEYHTPSMKILWNTWIFPFHTVKCGVWKDLDTWSEVSDGQCSLINVLFGLDHIYYNKFHGNTHLILIVHITDLFSMIGFYFTVAYIFQSEIIAFFPLFFVEICMLLFWPKWLCFMLHVEINSSSYLSFIL